MIVNASTDSTSLPLKPNATDIGGVLGGKYGVASMQYEKRSNMKQGNLRKQEN
jgi:hypothetical protein